MTKLVELVEAYSANGFVLADAGNGCGLGDAGVFVPFDEALSADYGDVELEALAEPHWSDDGFECRYASAWLTKGEGDNAYRVRVFF